MSGDVDKVAPSADEGFIGVDQVADYLKLKPGTLYQLVNKKAIPFHKSGKRLLFRKTELNDWIKERK